MPVVSSRFEIRYRTFYEMRPSPSANKRLISDAFVSVVLPVYNEQAVLRRLTYLLSDTLRRCGCRFELIFVNDGSSDDTARILDALAQDHPQMRVLHFSRNFGHQAAVQAGLCDARGDAVVVMDSDMQDDPASVPQFLKKWQDGYDVVYAVRFSRKEGPAKRALFFLFYRVLNVIAQMPIPMDAGNFGLVDARVARHIARLIDRDRYYPGLRRWVGFRQIGIPVERKARHDDRPRVSLRQLFALAKAAVFSFSSLPLTMFYGIALVSMLLCLVLSGFTLCHKIVGLASPGWTSTLMTASFFGAVNALGIGILGEYVTRIYDQVRARPMFIVERTVGFPPANEAPIAFEGNTSVVRSERIGMFELADASAVQAGIETSSGFDSGIDD